MFICGSPKDFKYLILYECRVGYIWRSAWMQWRGISSRVGSSCVNNILGPTAIKASKNCEGLNCCRLACRWLPFPVSVSSWSVQPLFKWKHFNLNPICSLIFYSLINTTLCFPFCFEVTNLSIVECVVFGLLPHRSRNIANLGPCFLTDSSDVSMQCELPGWKNSKRVRQGNPERKMRWQLLVMKKMELDWGKWWNANETIKLSQTNLDCLIKETIFVKEKFSCLNWN